jgi:hypothetical protein
LRRSTAACRLAILPPGTVLIDESEKHGGRQSLRLERTEASAGEVSQRSFSRTPIDFSGRTVELRGWLRPPRRRSAKPLAADRTRRNAPLAFIDMSSAPQPGDSWERHSISFPLNTEARTLVFGVRLVWCRKIVGRTISSCWSMESPSLRPRE